MPLGFMLLLLCFKISDLNENVYRMKEFLPFRNELLSPNSPARVLCVRERFEVRAVEMLEI
jgi:hypothetical protein